jgi:hypothetical protein
MHHMVTAEHPAKRRSRKWRKNADRLTGAGQETRTFVRTAVRCLQDQSAPTAPQPLSRLIEPCHRLAGTTREPQQLADPPNQSRFKHGRKIGGYDDRTSRSPGEGAP